MVQQPAVTTAIARQTGGVGGAVAVNAVTGLPILGPDITGTRGRGQVMFRTIIQRIRMADGAVLSQQIRTGKPWLMNSEVAALKRVSRMVGKAHGKIPRKFVRPSLKTVSKDVQEFAQVQLLLKALSDGKAC